MNEYLKASLKNLPSFAQRQDAVSDQLKDLIAVAYRLGMYDAADFLVLAMEKGINTSGVDHPAE